MRDPGQQHLIRYQLGDLVRYLPRFRLANFLKSKILPAMISKKLPRGSGKHFDRLWARSASK